MVTQEFKVLLVFTFLSAKFVSVFQLVARLGLKILFEFSTFRKHFVFISISRKVNGFFYVYIDEIYAKRVILQVQHREFKDNTSSRYLMRTRREP